MKELRCLTVGAVSSIREKIQMLQPEDRLNLSSFLTLKVKLDYDNEDIFLQISSLTEYPRRLACHKEPMTVRWIEQYVNEGDIFYDIGSNVGAYGLLAAKVKKATVIAFEPAFFNYVSACRNVLINGCHDKISVFPLAISSKTQADYFNYADLNSGSADHSLGEPINYRNEQFVAMYRQPVIAYALDDLISQFDFPVPSHIKIDVDGTEMNVLKGAQRTLENPTLRTIMIEISERRAPAVAITAYLNPKGWSLAERYDRPVKAGQSDVSYLLFVR
jgi:FkbM family methyltransferase